MSEKIGTIKLSELEFIVREARAKGAKANTKLTVSLDKDTFVGMDAVRIDDYPVAYLRTGKSVTHR